MSEVELVKAGLLEVIRAREKLVTIEDEAAISSALALIERLTKERDEARAEQDLLKDQVNHLCDELKDNEHG